MSGVNSGPELVRTGIDSRKPTHHDFVTTVSNAPNVRFYEPEGMSVQWLATPEVTDPGRVFSE